MQGNDAKPTTDCTADGDADGVKSQSCRVLVVDDDADSRALIQGFLITEGYEVVTADCAESAKHLLLESGANILITDWHMPGMSGVELCRALRQTDAIDFLFIIICTTRSDRGALLQAFEAGADDFLSKPLDRAELLARMRSGLRFIHLQADLAKRNREVFLANARMAITARDLEDANNRLRILATTDDLTGFLNRREAMSRLEKHWAQSERTDAPLSAILLDIDRFKRFNDTHGHAVGDLVLREMTQALRTASRTYDELCRLGGEEFLIICPTTNVDDAMCAAERFRLAVEALKIKHGSEQLNVTISLGVAERSVLNTPNPDELISAADEALYVAKNEGRNCVRRAVLQSQANASATTR